MPEASSRATQCRGCSKTLIFGQERENSEITFLRCFAEPIGPSFLLCTECAKKALAALDDMSYEQTLEDQALRHTSRIPRSIDPHVVPDEKLTLEELETKHTEASRLFAEAQRTSDDMAARREQLRVRIALRRQTCLCADGDRHESCVRLRPWCMMNDCLCAICRRKLIKDQKLEGSGAMLGDIAAVVLGYFPTCRSCGRKDGTHETHCGAQQLSQQRKLQAACDHRSDYGTRRTTGDPPGPDCCGRCGLELPHVEI